MFDGTNRESVVTNFYIFMQMYGPMAIMTGLGYLQFDTACSDAGLCSLPPGPGKLNLEQQEFAALQEATT